MPWKEKTVMDSRMEFVRRVLAREKSKSALCREYGISRVTGDKWLKRYVAGESLADLSRAPLSRPNRIPQATEEHIIGMRTSMPVLGAKKIHQMMINEGKVEPPSISTINAVLKRNNLITKEASQAAQHYVRFEKDEPNDLWQLDFKGHFQLQNNTRCHPLSVLDDKSCFCLNADAHENEQFPGVKASLIKTFQKYGLPKTVLCDNGNPWGSSQSTSITRFEVWLMELGVLTTHIRSMRPQTQGKVERFNGSYKREKLNFYIPQDMEDAQICREEYRKFYNEVRPHEAIGMKCPAQVYTESDRKYNEEIEPWDYEAGGERRKIKSSGYLTFQGQGYYLSEGLGEKEVVLYPNPDKDGIYDIIFRQFIVAKLSLHDCTIHSRKIYLRYDDPRKKL